MGIPNKFFERPNGEAQLPPIMARQQSAETTFSAK